ncbi:MAG: BMP family ABC transporter substrate-binding protein [Oscillospiraceae bacterium]|nr:BMP family ABC transporter substrate-binding protein [Oscillospiraceae bacterium]
MKKLIAIVLALTLCLCLFAACAPKEKPADGADNAEGTENTENRDANVKFDNSSEMVDVSSLTSEQTAKIKVGLIYLHDENSTYDLNFMNASKEACEKIGVEYLIKTNIPEGQECYEAAAELVDAGCNIIFADSFGHEPYMIEAAKEFPEVEFCHATGTRAHMEGLSNYHNAFATIYEGRYLGGVAAGMKLNEMIENGYITADEAKIGYVGAFTYAEVISGYTSFFLGARSVCPSATMEVTFTGSWYDETAEKEGANKLISNGCVLISLHADSMGAPTACQTAGVPFVFYNGACADACPDTFIVSSRINWEPYTEYMIGKVAKGEALSADWTGTLSNGAVVMSEVNEKAAAPGTAEKLEEVKADLIAGKIKVFDTSTFTVEGKEITTYLADLNDWGDFTGETEVIENGVFNESALRSAPAFDLNIDGITLLDTNFG